MDELPAFVLLNETLHSVASGTRRDLLRQIRSTGQADTLRAGQARDEGDTIPSRSSSSGQLQPHAPAQVEGQARQKIKLTPWRLVNTIVILSIGLPKAVYSYLGYPVTVNTLDWALGLCWCLGAFWLSIFESEQQDFWPWFFQCDLVLPISIVQVACAMFATFFVISLSLTTPMWLLQRILRSTNRDLVISSTAAFGVFSLLYIACASKTCRGRRPRLFSLVLRPLRAFLKLFYSTEQDVRFRDQGFIFIWLPFFIGGLLYLEETFELSVDFSTFQCCLLISFAFGTSAVITSGVMLSVAGVIRIAFYFYDNFSQAKATLLVGM